MYNELVGLGVVSLNNVQQEALLSDAELLKRLIQVAGSQCRTIQAHRATGIIYAIVFQAGTQSSVLIDDNGLTLQIVANSNFNYS